MSESEPGRADPDAVPVTQLLQELKECAEQAGQLDRRIDELARYARSKGASLSQVGQALGISPQGAHRRLSQEAKQRDREAKARLRERAARQ